MPRRSVEQKSLHRKRCLCERKLIPSFSRGLPKISPFCSLDSQMKTSWLVQERMSCWEWSNLPSNTRNFWCGRRRRLNWCGTWNVTGKWWAAAAAARENGSKRKADESGIAFLCDTAKMGFRASSAHADVLLILCTMHSSNECLVSYFILQVRRRDARIFWDLLFTKERQVGFYMATKEREER